MNKQRSGCDATNGSEDTKRKGADDANKYDGSVESTDLFCEFVSMLKSAYANKCDPESEKNCRWLIELPMTDEQVAIWDKVMNPPQNAKSIEPNQR